MSEASELLVSFVDPQIELATHKTMRRFWRHVEREDVKQELVLWVLTHERKVEQYLDEEREHSLVKALEHAGLAYAQREKAAQAGYHTDDLFYWQVEEIEALLSSMFSDEARLHPPSSDDGTGGRSNRPPNEGGNWIATLADLSRAYGKLDEETKRVLRLVYGEDQKRAWVAEAMGVSDTTISNRINRGLRAMHRELGGERPTRHRDQVTGSRTALSNAAARALTDAQYDEE